MNEDNFNDLNNDDPYEIRDDGESSDESREAATHDENVTAAPSENEASASPSDSEAMQEDQPNEPPDRSANEEANQIGSDIIRGHINTIILRALYERDKYGYEIMNDIEQKSHGQYTLKQPTLYSALKRLENQGYICAYWKTDEVSSGGRRKYFTLTESGRKITEKNLAEWEYSRTIIDSLISDRSFDFSQPAPTPVDFTILRNSVSRVPVVRSDEEGRQTADGAFTEGQNSSQPPVAEQQPPQAQPPQQPPTAEAAQTAQTTENNQTPTAQPHTETSATVTQEQPAQQRTAENAPEQTQQQPPQQPPEQTQEQSQLAERAAQEEARRRAHENYLRLISEPVRPPEQTNDNVVPNSESVDTERLIYNNRPETERDYKNLIDGIFNRAVSNGSVQTTYSRPRQPQRQSVQPEAHVRLVDRGRADGVAVATSQRYESTASYATKTTFNKGITLLKCSAIVLAITAIEFIFCFIFLNQLQTTWVYPTVILTIGLVQFTVFGIMALKGYGKNCVIPTTNGYISSCVIFTIISILIISATSFLMNINPNLVSDIMKMIVIPSITALNITVFAVCFKAFLK